MRVGSRRSSSQPICQHGPVCERGFGTNEGVLEVWRSCASREKSHTEERNLSGATVGAALRGRPIGLSAGCSSDRAATEGRPYSYTVGPQFNLSVVAQQLAGNKKFFRRLIYWITQSTSGHDFEGALTRRARDPSCRDQRFLDGTSLRLLSEARRTILALWPWRRTNSRKHLPKAMT